MNFLLLLVLLVGCGKSPAPKYYQVDPLSIGADSDGDGMLDWDEVDRGRDAYLADVDQHLVKADERVTLLTDSGTQQTFQAKSYRLMRKLILESLARQSTGDLPSLNRLVFQVNHLKKFWENHLEGRAWSKFRAVIDRGGETVFPLTEQERLSGRLQVPSTGNESLIDSVRKKTYRLVVSLPEEELIYHLHPSVDPRSFLETKHRVFWDHNGELVGLDDYRQELPHPFSPDYSDKTFFWQALHWSLDLTAHPQAGETLVLAFVKTEELKGNALPDQGLEARTPGKFSGTLQQKIRFRIFVPATPQLNWSSKDESVTWTMTRERDGICFYKKGASLGSIPASTQGAQEFLAMINTEGLSDLKVSGYQRTEVGSTAIISGTFSEKQARIQWNPSYLEEVRPIGIFDSRCGDRMRNKFSNLPLRPSFTADLYWNSAEE